MKNIWKSKTIFITGANGFLGSHLTKHALGLDAKVIVLIKEEVTGSLFDIEGLSRRVKLIKGDLTDNKLISQIFRNNRIGLCMHIAAQAIVGIANQSPIPTLKTNIEGTWNILEAARLYGAGALIVASSDKAYGEHIKLPYKENAPLLALHPYDASKACADILTRVYAHTYGLNTAVTRCANIYGAGDSNFSRLIPDTIRSCIRGKNPVIRSDGTPLRDYIYVDDVVNAYFCLAGLLYNKKINAGEAFNFGTGNPVNVLSLVNKIIKISGNKELEPQIMSKRKIKGEIDRQYLNSEKAREMLDWKPCYTLDQGLRLAYEWYVEVLEA